MTKRWSVAVIDPGPNAIANRSQHWHSGHVTELAAQRQAETTVKGSKRPKAALNGARSFWLKQLHSWHWISAAVSLVGMILFAVTGITLNHAAQIPAEPVKIGRAHV